MVFVRRSASRSGATKVQLAERRAGRNVILDHAGTARSDAEVAVLMAEARRRLRRGRVRWTCRCPDRTCRRAGPQSLDLPLPGQDLPQGRAAVVVGRNSALLWRVLCDAYGRPGLDGVDGVGDAAFRDLVLARVVEPTSKADSVRVLDELGGPHESG